MVLGDGKVWTHRGPKEHHTRPAADPLFQSAARAHGARVLGVVLSGCGADATLGCIRIHGAGGLIVIQDEREAAFPSMPRSARLHDHVAAMLPVGALGEAITRLAPGLSVDPTAFQRPA